MASSWQVISKAEIEKIHEASLHILQKTGIEVRYGTAREVFKKAGARVEETRVFLPAKLVENKVREAPEEFTLYARNPEKNLKVGDNHLVLAPGYGAPFIVDLENRRRKATFQDFENLTKLAGASVNLDLTGGVLVEPNDLPDHIRHVKMIYASITNSDKCFMGSASGGQKARDSIKMAEILFGPEHSLQEKPALISLINTITPLILDERMLGALMEYARAGQAVIIASLAMAGATSPASLAGTLALQNAEVLAGIVLAQLVRPGTPVVYGAASSITEMRYGSLAIGTPETALITAASAQLASYYGLPSRSGGALTDAKIPDIQAGWESILNLLAAAQSGINFVLHATGILEYYMAMSYEKFMIDEELCGLVRRVKKGIQISDETLACSVIDEVGPGGHFLDQDHTLNTFRSEFWRPSISHRGNYDQWMEGGAFTVGQRAKERCLQILEEYQAPTLEPGIEKSLRTFMEGLIGG
ncbi:MAG TPA: trimethylamine methyltransferase family protein [Clostridia bacterium]|nr:trimethylamine methyltransferase family protein [Clostridia bacterium]